MIIVVNWVTFLIIWKIRGSIVKARKCEDWNIKIFPPLARKVRWVNIFNKYSETLAKVSIRPSSISSLFISSSLTSKP